MEKRKRKISNNFEKNDNKLKNRYTSHRAQKNENFSIFNSIFNKTINLKSNIPKKTNSNTIWFFDISNKNLAENFIKLYLKINNISLIKNKTENIEDLKINNYEIIKNEEKLEIKIIKNNNLIMKDFYKLLKRYVIILFDNHKKVLNLKKNNNNIKFKDERVKYLFIFFTIDNFNNDFNKYLNKINKFILICPILVSDKNQKIDYLINEKNKINKISKSMGSLSCFKFSSKNQFFEKLNYQLVGEKGPILLNYNSKKYKYIDYGTKSLDYCCFISLLNNINLDYIEYKKEIKYNNFLKKIKKWDFKKNNSMHIGLGFAVGISLASLYLKFKK